MKIVGLRRLNCG